MAEKKEFQLMVAVKRDAIRVAVYERYTKQLTGP